MNMIDVMSRLSETRFAFHSEADFQHSLGWMIRDLFPDARVWPEVRTFYPIEIVNNKPKRRSLDLLVQKGKHRYALELKYKTAKVNEGKAILVTDTEFIIPQEDAQDQGRYDFLADSMRLENAVAEQQNLTCYAILLTNDPRYWEIPAKPPRTNDRAFRIHTGRDLPKRMDWQPNTAPSTKKGREKTIKLMKNYPLNWRHYQTIPGTKNNEFQYLMISIPW